jgi:hypothetical protein
VNLISRRPIQFSRGYLVRCAYIYCEVYNHLCDCRRTWTRGHENFTLLKLSSPYDKHVLTGELTNTGSHIPAVSGLGPTLGFHASDGSNGPTKAQYRFVDKRRKLEISAIKLDTIKSTGIAVGTFCESQDYLNAFLHWRAMLLHDFQIEEGNESHPLHRIFCETLCLGQVPHEHRQLQSWHNLSYHVFASLIQEKLPRLPIDEDLARYAAATGFIKPDERRKFLQDHFGNRMVGRSFCITEQGLIGMGSGYMTAGDLVVVPFGCSTPILLRHEGRRNEYHYVGDVYVEGYMHGEAISQMEAKDPQRAVSKFMLC